MFGSQGSGDGRGGSSRGKQREGGGINRGGGGKEIQNEHTVNGYSAAASIKTVNCQYVCNIVCVLPP